MTLDDILNSGDKAVKVKRLKDVGQLDGRVGNPRILTIDIENSPIKADVWGLWQNNVSLNQIREVGQVISFAAKWYGQPKVEFRSDFHDGHDAMVKRSHELYDEADIIYGWNSHRFDGPHLKREWLLAGLGPVSPYKDVDLMLVAKREFKFASNKLDFIAQQLGVGSKLAHQGHTLWRRCEENDPAAWAIMRKYNIQDTKITEAVADVLRPWIKGHPIMGVMATPDEQSCVRCGSLELRKTDKTYRVNLIDYVLYQCKCGGYVKGERYGRGGNSRGV
jgi:hypothetical protein